MRGHNRSSTSIFVSWDKVPADKRNGIITSYTIYYQSLTENDNGSVQVTGNPLAQGRLITELKEYVEYNITVLASTVKGDGPRSTPVEVVRTDQDSKLKLSQICLTNIICLVLFTRIDLCKRRDCTESLNQPTKKIYEL